ncbi:hypothetical protein Tco_1445578 [Tanacetum coccineum]
MATRVAMPFGVGNFIIAWMVDKIALRSRILVHPKMMLYEDDARTTVNFIIVIQHRPSLLNATSNSTFPIADSNHWCNVPSHHISHSIYLDFLSWVFRPSDGKVKAAVGVLLPISPLVI